MSLGQRIKKIRLERGETLDEFGKRIGARDSNVSRWENGKDRPHVERLKAIADLAGITVDELLNDTCNWQLISDSVYGTSCYKIFYDKGNFNHVDSDFEYCPYCGKGVEVSLD